MTSEERIKKQKHLVEEIGRYFDKEGFQPIAGRILGLLMVMDKEQFTFDEIIEELQISKSSASNALKNLEIRDKIEYVTLPGDRKRYFQLKRHDPSAIIEDLEKKMQATLLLFKNITELKADKNSKNSLFLNKMINMTNYFLDTIKSSKEKFASNK